MGYRSTFITDDQELVLPDWFVEKWQDSVFIKPDHKLPIASKQEMKAYGYWRALPYDLQKVLQELSYYEGRSIHLVFLHEDGLLLRLSIFSDHFEDEKEETVAF